MIQAYYACLTAQVLSRKHKQVPPKNRVKNKAYAAYKSLPYQTTFLYILLQYALRKNAATEKKKTQNC